MGSAVAIWNMKVQTVAWSRCAPKPRSTAKNVVVEVSVIDLRKNAIVLQVILELTVLLMMAVVKSVSTVFVNMVTVSVTSAFPVKVVKLRTSVKMTVCFVGFVI